MMVSPAQNRTAMTDASFEIDFDFAARADAAAVAALIERAYRGPVAATGWTNESELLIGPRSSLGEVEELIGETGSRFVMARHRGELVGCALIQKLGQGAYFGMFAIDPDRQASGLGKTVIARAETAARELWGATFMRLTVISLRDQLIAWYERRGYINTGFRERFPFETATGALRTDFDLIVLEKPL
jgi:ribosomal protein S18 acetylase RimI-like enzyme